MSKKKILIVDDDAELGEEMAELLEAEGHSADIVSDGAKSLALIRNNGYNVFLLDFKIQGMTGIDLLKEIRKKDRKAAVFFISGRPGLDAVLKEENLYDIVTGIIEKPFDPQILLEKIRTC